MPRAPRPFQSERSVLFRSRKNSIIIYDADVVAKAKTAILAALEKISDYVESGEAQPQFLLQVIEMVGPYTSNTVNETDDTGAAQIEAGDSLQEAIAKLPAGELAEVQIALDKARGMTVTPLRRIGEG